MQQLTMTESRTVEWWDVPEPTLQDDGSALVRPLAVSMCDLDQPIISGRAPLAGPIALGHEFVAKVTDVGDAVASVTVGDLVAVPFQISCGVCARCKAGLTASCTTVPPRSSFGFGAFGGANWGGALSDLVRVPFADHMLVPMPSGVAPATAACISDNATDGWRTVAPHLRARPGADVLVVGGGAPSIPLYAVDAARALGAGSVTYVDTDAERLAIARGLGAEVIEGPPEYSYDHRPITVDASAAHDGLAAALRSTEPGGVCTSIGGYYTEATTPVPMAEMYAVGFTFITGRAHVRVDMPEFLNLVAQGRLRPDAVTTQTVAWEDAASAVPERWTKLVVAR